MNAIVNGYRRELEKTVREIKEHKKEKDVYKEKRVRGILVNLNWLSDKYKIERIAKIEEHELGYPIMGEEDKDYMLKIVNVNLCKYEKLCYDNVKEEEKHWKLFTVKNEEELKNYKKEEMLKVYFNTLKNISSDEEGLKKGNEEGFKLGNKKGRQEEKENIVLKMYKDNLDLNVISKYTDLDISQIKKIIAKK